MSHTHCTCNYIIIGYQLEGVAVLKKYLKGIVLSGKKPEEEKTHETVDFGLSTSQSVIIQETLMVEEKHASLSTSIFHTVFYIF